MVVVAGVRGQRWTQCSASPMVRVVVRAVQVVVQGIVVVLEHVARETQVPLSAKVWEVVVVDLGRRGAQGHPPQPVSLLMRALVAVLFWAVALGHNF